MSSLLSSHARKSVQELTYTTFQTQDAPELTTLAHTSSGQELRRIQGEHICKGYCIFGHPLTLLPVVGSVCQRTPARL